MFTVQILIRLKFRFSCVRLQKFIDEDGSKATIHLNNLRSFTLYCIPNIESGQIIFYFLEYFCFSFFYFFTNPNLKIV